MPNLRRALVAAPLALMTMWATPSGAAPHRAERAYLQLPNLVALSPSDLSIETSDDGDGLALRLAASTANRGLYAFDLLAVPTAAGMEAADAHQCVEWAGPRACLTRQPVGRFVWHQTHGHLHFEDYALYELRRLREDDRNPDMTPDGLAATGGKISFCLIDYEPDDPNRGPLYSEAHVLYYSCLAGVGFQGISPGWRDTYEAYLEGQEIPLDGVEDGEYAVVMTVDPDNRLYETSETDNVSFTRVRLSSNASDLEVLP